MLVSLQADRGPAQLSWTQGERSVCCMKSTGHPALRVDLLPTHDSVLVHRVRQIFQALGTVHSATSGVRILCHRIAARLTGNFGAGTTPTHRDRRMQVPHVKIFVLKLQFQHWPPTLPAVFLEGTKSLDSFFETRFARCPSLDDRGLPASHSFK